MIATMKATGTTLAAVLLAVLVLLAQGQDSFKFNYLATDGTDFGPADWDKVGCVNKDICLGWPDGWELANGWTLGSSCKWCPAGEEKLCGEYHHQSPINLLRNKAVNESETFNECIDVHWMKYEDSSCSWQDLIDGEAFSIETHALKISQPLEAAGADGVRLACPGKISSDRLFGRIDFSKGFSHWWFLSHIDFKVPSEHTQEGKRYSGEIQMAHFYSEKGADIAVDNEMAHVSMFIEEYDDVPPYPFLDRAICQWRRVEEEARLGCGLPSVPPYPGCYPFTRDIEDEVGVGNRNLRRESNEKDADTDEQEHPRRLTAIELHQRNMELYANDLIMKSGGNLNDVRKLEMDDSNWRDSDMTEAEWKEFIQDYSRTDSDRIERWRSGDHRELALDGWDQPFHNYQPLIDVKTEYYYRYHGTQTIPPCYGRWEDAMTTLQFRGYTNHWRVMKDPIRVHPRQVKEMHRLLRERINPVSENRDGRTACAKETAGVVDEQSGQINVARPLQYTSETHFKVFCECNDWPSKWPEDRQWCGSGNQAYRFWENPYNFKNDGDF